MRAYRAAWVLPIAGPPVADAVVAIDGDRIVAIDSSTVDSVVDLGRVALLPGLVNAHTHLELSWLRDRVPPRSSFDAWVRDLMRQRRETADPPIQAAIAEAIGEAQRCGTSLVGDIANTLATAGPLLASRLGGVVFREVIAFQSSKADEVVSRALDELQGVPWTAGLRGTLATHAPYSVSPALFRAVGDYVATTGNVTSVHVAESPEEVEFIRTGSGPPRAMLERLQVWDSTWPIPCCSPVEYLDRLGVLGPRTIAVHCVQTRADDLHVLRQRGATVVTCPRSNEWTGAGQAPIARFFESGVRVAIGTDSLASAPDVNVFAELAAARRLAPAIPARDLLCAATLNGAKALGFGETHGSIAPGKQAFLIAVALPADVEDVEEYLVSGVPAAQVKWIGD